MHTKLNEGEGGIGSEVVKTTSNKDGRSKPKRRREG